MDISRVSINELAKTCAHSENASEWAELLRRCAPFISVAALRSSRVWVKNPSPAIVDDIVQEVFLKLCEQDRRILREFQPRGEDSFFGLLRIISCSVANDFFRRVHSVKRGGKVQTASLSDEGGQESPQQDQSTDDLMQNVLFAQIDDKLRSSPEVISSRDRILFWLYYRQGFTAEEIAVVGKTGLTAKGVESALRRISRWVKEELDHPPPPQSS